LGVHQHGLRDVGGEGGLRVVAEGEGEQQKEHL